MGIPIIVHRYLGVAVGLLMTLWCLSGFVMMYQSYPELTPGERLSGLESLQLSQCCRLDAAPLSDETIISDFQIEMLAGKPVLKVLPEGGPRMILDLSGGAPLEGLSPDQVLAVASAYGTGAGIEGRARLLPALVRDQWTVQYARRNQPLHHLAFGDPAKSEIYVAGTSGEVLQDTNARERLLGWLGAVPHWLYPTLLRENAKLWIQVVIWTSVVGVFLTGTGLYIGISRWLAAPKGRVSPFRGLWMWHHMIGLFFGVLTLTWVASGLLSMNPWGLLEGGGSPAPDQFAGKVTWRAAKDFVALTPGLADGKAVQIKAAPVAGRLFAVRLDRSGGVMRFDGLGQAAPLMRAEVEAALAGLETPPAVLNELGVEDAYYYGHHTKRKLPVYRAVLSDADATRLYIDVDTGSVLRVAGANERKYRWLQSGLHDFDFPGLRRRPIWDVVVLMFLTGVTALSVTGLWLAFKRIARDAETLKSRRRRKGQPS